MQTSEMQELLLSIMPHWYCYIAKPFKQLLAEGISLDMYYCIRILGECSENITMSELAKWMHMSKQQLTKLVDKMIERAFVERVADPNDRRIVRLQLTQNAQKYIDSFLAEDAVYYRELFDSMTEKDREEFGNALSVMQRTFIHMAKEKSKSERE